jgi:hypothetical protein
MFFSQHFSFPCQYHSTIAPYPSIHLHSALTRRTNMRSLGTFPKAMSFRQSTCSVYKRTVFECTDCHRRHCTCQSVYRLSQAALYMSVSVPTVTGGTVHGSQCTDCHERHCTCLTYGRHGNLVLGGSPLAIKDIYRHPVKRQYELYPKHS